MSALSKNMKSDFTKLATEIAERLVKPLAALLAAALLGALPAAWAQAPASAAQATTVLVVGDSLSAEYGLKRGTGWVPLLEKQLADEKRTPGSSTPASAATPPRAAAPACRPCWRSTSLPWW